MAVDIITEPGRFISEWYVPAPGRLSAYVSVPGAGTDENLTWTWNGKYFQR